MITLQCQDVHFDDIAAILFDKDGTLADSKPYLQKLAIARSRCLDQQVPGTGERLLAAFGCQGEHYDPTGLMAVGTRYENEIAAATYVAEAGRAWGEALAIAKAAFGESERHFGRKALTTPPFAGIPDLLRRLHSWGLKLAVLSGDTTANVQDFVDCYRLTDVVEWCAGSERSPVKPDPQMLWTACEKLGVDPATSLVIGDSVLDWQLAHQGGAKGFISVTWGGSPKVPAADGILTRPEQLQPQPWSEETQQMPHLR